MINADSVALLDWLELIDDLGRLGLGYPVEKEIKRALNFISTEDCDLGTEEGLHAIALCFRLLRQHGYEVSQGENILDEARGFTTTHLKEIKGPIAPSLAKQVNHSLELPLHWGMRRLEARWYIEACKNYINTDLLELPKLDLNMVQAIHQKDLRDSSRKGWWRDLGLGSHSELSFLGDRLMECFLWTVGMIFEPEFDYCRKELTKVNQLLTTIDDVYDIYGTIDELELFTNVVERWDINAMERLPNYMKICFLSLYNTFNEMAYDILKQTGWNIIPYLKKVFQIKSLAKQE